MRGYRRLSFEGDKTKHNYHISNALIYGNSRMDQTTSSYIVYYTGYYNSCNKVNRCQIKPSFMLFGLNRKSHLLICCGVAER